MKRLAVLVLAILLAYPAAALAFTPGDQVTYVTGTTTTIARTGTLLVETPSLDLIARAGTTSTQDQVAPSVVHPAATPTPTPSTSPSPSPTATDTPSPSPSPSPTPNPTPSPTPTPTPTPAPAPAPSAGVPDSTNTGPVAAVGCTQPLVPMSGTTVTQSGTVIQNADITGELDIRASNVTVRCSRVRSTGYRAIQVNGSAMIDRVEAIGPTTLDGCDATINMANSTVTQSNIHGCEDGFKLASNSTIQDSYIHGLQSGGSPHYDGIQIMGPASHIVIQGNNIEPRSPTPTGTSSMTNSAIFIKPDFGAIDDVLVQANRLNCGTWIASSGKFSAPYPSPSNVRFIDNRWGRCYEFGRVSFPDGNVVETGSVWDDTDQPITGG